MEGGGFEEYNAQPKTKTQARCWWLTPVILATWESEIGKMEV
jgi:hypothetical protein